MNQLERLAEEPRLITVAKLEAVYKAALAPTESLEEVKKIRDKAEVFPLYLKYHTTGADLQDLACEIKARADRRMGEMISAVERRPGQHRLPVRGTQTGTSYHDVMRFLQRPGRGRCLYTNGRFGSFLLWQAIMLLHWITCLTVCIPWVKGEFHHQGKEGKTMSGMSASALHSLRITVGRELFLFETFDDWVNTAVHQFTTCAVMPREVICIDSGGLICGTEKQFMRARDSGTVPVRAYAITPEQSPADNL